MTRNLNLLGLWGLSTILLFAFLDQIVLHDLPCPLCLLQRAAFVAAGVGFALNVTFGSSPAHYGVTLLSAIAGAAMSARQILLHIVPGSGSFGQPFLGLHFYTWGLTAFVLTAVAVGVLLLVEETAAPGHGRSAATPASRVAVGLFLALALANAASTLLECGPGMCPDNPVSYQLLRW